MFNTVLDVTIGMIFVYLLLSLMCSAANEIIELMLKKRAIDLERGIREMLAPGSKSGTKDIVQKLYDHSLINNLFDKRYEDTRIASAKRYLMRTHLPSYIPARSFALALMDLVGASPAAGAAAPATPPISGATGATPPANFAITLTVPPPAPPPPGDPANPLTPLRQGIASSPLLNAVPEVRQALIALVDAAGDDIAKARENIETWFNTSMDRVSSWYKRRTQVIILILGLFVAVAVNADSIAIAKRLSTDKALRDTLVAASLEYAKAHASPTPTPSPDSGSQKEEGAKQPEPPECVKDPNSKDCKFAKACKEPDSPECRFLTNRKELESLGLPIGWDAQDDPKRKWPGWHWKSDGGWWDQIYWHGLGWLLTALAISLGAPFWFDLLNKFIVIRSAVKPHEKSPEKESKG